MKRITGCLSLLLLLSALSTGCGGTDDEPKDDTEPDPTSGPPLELTAENLGVGLHHGESGVLREGGLSDVIDQTKSTFSHAFLYVQAYDEHSWKFGEWEVHPHPDPQGSDYRGLREFKTEPTNGRFEPRAGDIKKEVESTFGKDGIENIGIVLDVWRMRGDWYVRWDGNLNEDANLYGEGEYGFYRADMVDSLLDQIEEVANRYDPDYMILGTNMERLLATDDGGEGLAPDDFSNYKRFFQNAVERIDGVSPDTRVAAGFNWDRFALQVAPTFGEAERGEIPSEETLAIAFEAVILPFVESGGMLALKSYRKPTGPADYYGFLAGIDERFEMEDALFAWYSIGSPVTNSSSYRRQRTYLENFIEWNKGVEPDIVAWNSLINIDGADRGNQMIGGRCKQMIDSEKFQLEQEHCFDGLMSTLFEPKDSYELILDSVE